MIDRKTRKGWDLVVDDMIPLGNSVSSKIYSNIGGSPYDIFEVEYDIKIFTSIAGKTIQFMPNGVAPGTISLKVQGTNSPVNNNGTSGEIGAISANNEGFLWGSVKIIGGAVGIYSALHGTFESGMYEAGLGKGFQTGMHFLGSGTSLSSVGIVLTASTFSGHIKIWKKME